MNKYIVFICLALFGCTYSGPAYTPKFAVGDCVSDTDLICEKWEIGPGCKEYVSVILDVGVLKYHTLFKNVRDSGGFTAWSEDIKAADFIYTKRECPKILKEKYDEYRKKQ